MILARFARFATGPKRFWRVAISSQTKDATVEGQVAAGTVTVICGTANGLNSATGSQLWSEARNDVPGIEGAGDLGGYAIKRQPGDQFVS